MAIKNLIIFAPSLVIFGLVLIFSPSHWGLKERYMLYSGKLKLYKEKLPARAYFIKIKAARNKEQMMQELSESLAYIKNISVLGRGKSISTILLLEELSEFCPLMSKTYLEMARCLSVNDKEKARNTFLLVLDDSYAKDIGMFLTGWEEIPQSDLLNTVDAYREAMKQERNTKIQKRDELISDLIYFPVVLNCMTVLLNFIYVAYFIEQKDALLSLFF